MRSTSFSQFAENDEAAISAQSIAGQLNQLLNQLNQLLNQLNQLNQLLKGGGNVTDQAREARKIYKREWNRKNRDKVKAAQERYWEKRAQRVARAGEPQTQAAQQEEGE